MTRACRWSSTPVARPECGCVSNRGAVDPAGAVLLRTVGIVAVVQKEKSVLAELEDLLDAAPGRVGPAYAGARWGRRPAKSGCAAAHCRRRGSRRCGAHRAKRSAPLSPVAIKASAGASEHVRIARVVNLVRALEQMKAANIWSVGLDERGSIDYDEFDFTGDCVLVLGREGAGLHDLVRKTCDHLLKIPMARRRSRCSLNVVGGRGRSHSTRPRDSGVERHKTVARRVQSRKSR